MSLAKTRTVLASLTALFCLATTGIVRPTVAADPPTSPSRKDAPPRAVPPLEEPGGAGKSTLPLHKDAPASVAKLREVGKLTSLPGGAIVKLTFALDGERLIVECWPPPPPPKFQGSGDFINPERKPDPPIYHTVWNWSSHKFARLHPMAHGWGGNLLLSSDVRTLAVWKGVREAQGAGFQLQYEFYDLATQRKVARPEVWKWLTKTATPLAFSPDGKVAAVKNTNAHAVELFDVESGKQISKIERRDDQWLVGLPGVLFSGDGKVLAVPFRDTSELAVYDVAGGKELRKFDKFEQGSVLALSTDGKTLAVGNPGSAEVRLWNVVSGKQTARWQGHKPGVNDLAISADGKVLFAAGDKLIRVWDVAGKREVAPLRGHLSMVRILAVSPDGKHLASGGADKSVRLWDISAYAPESKSQSQSSDKQQP